MVRRWAMSDPRNTRFETSERYSSFFRNSESNRAIRTATDKHRKHRSGKKTELKTIGYAAVALSGVVEDQPLYLRLRAEVQQQTNLDRCRAEVVEELALVS